jgi:ribosome-associated toxin RatA of RatAB toxin-antitoxin module
MADQATERTTIAAPPTRCFEAAIDFERYPQWARDIKQATVDRRDDEGRGLEVTYRAAAMGRSTSYTLRYDYASAPECLSWELLRGDLTRRLDGRYEFQPAGGDGSSTHVTYHLEVDLKFPLPGFVKRRAESMIIHTALRELKQYVEGSTRRVQ